MSLFRIMRYLIILLGFMSITGAYASHIDIKTGTNIQSNFEYLADLSGQATIEDITGLDNSNWSYVDSGSANFGITQTPYWMRFSIRNLETEKHSFIAELDYSQLDDVQFYVFLGKSNIHRFTTGDAHPFYPREARKTTIAL